MGGTPTPIAQPSTTAPSNGTSSSSASDWRAALPEDLRTEPSLVGFRDVPSLAKSFVDTKRMVGNSIRVPQAGAAQDEWNELYTKLGRPESPDKYDLKAPDGIEVNPTLDAWARGTFHKAGLTPQQAKIIYDGYLEQAGTLQGQEVNQRNQQLEETVLALKQEWGFAYDQNVTRAKNAVDYLAKKAGVGDALMDALYDTGAGNNPIVVKALAIYGKALEEGGFVTGEPHNMEDDKAEALREIEAMKANPDNYPLSVFNRKLYGKGMDMAVENWRKLHDRAYPPESEK